MINAGLFAHAKGETVEGLLKNCVDKVAQVDQQNQSISSHLQSAHELLDHRICTPVLKRYNSYDDVGGNQSFSVAFIDPQQSGLILSALHSRQGAMVYAKWVTEGKSPHNLSAEEQEVLAEAIKRLGSPLAN